MKFKASLDLKSKIITGFVGALFLAITVYNVKRIGAKTEINTETIVLGLLTLLIVSMFVLCYLYRPLGYVVENNKVIVQRPIKNLIINFSNIHEAFLPTKESMKWTIRTFGNGGLFGYFGSFNNSNYGEMIWYATKTSNYLMIVTKDKTKIVLTPDDMAMIHEIIN